VSGRPAEDDVVDPVGVEAGVSVSNLVDQSDRQVDWLDRVKGSAGLPLASGRADRVEHQCLGLSHSFLLRCLEDRSQN
jgi:hypothetical protein